MNFEDFLALAQLEGEKVFLYSQEKKQGYVMMPAEQYAAQIGAPVEDPWDDVWDLPEFQPEEPFMPFEDDPGFSHIAADDVDVSWEDKLREASEQGDERATRMMEGFEAAKQEVEANPNGPESIYEPVTSDDAEEIDDLSWQSEQPLDPEGEDPVFFEEPLS